MSKWQFAAIIFAALIIQALIGGAPLFESNKSAPRRATASQHHPRQPSTTLATNQKATCEHDAKTFRCVEYVRNYDGDTVTVRIPRVHPLIGENISVRVLGVDTPEKNGKRPCEKERAREAQKLVENLLKNAQNIELKNIGRDKYFRILAEVWADQISIADILIKNKLAYPYDGGRKPASVDWCNRR